MRAKALIITDNYEFSKAFAETLWTRQIDVKSEIYRPGMAPDINHIGPDILFADTLHECNVLELLKGVRRERGLLALARVEQRTREQQKNLTRAGVSYIFTHDMCAKDTALCAATLYDRHRERLQKLHVHADLIRLMSDCKFIPSNFGYHYIKRGALYLYRKGHGRYKPAAEEVYDFIAKTDRRVETRASAKAGGKPNIESVEKDIRVAVKNAWERGGWNTMPQVLHCGRGRRPGNLNLLMLLSSRLRERH